MEWADLRGAGNKGEESESVNLHTDFQLLSTSRGRLWRPHLLPLMWRGLQQNWLAHPHATIWWTSRSWHQTIRTFEVLKRSRLNSSSEAASFFPDAFSLGLHGVGKAQAQESHMLVFESQLLQLIAVWPTESHLTSLCLKFTDDNHSKLIDYEASHRIITYKMSASLKAPI